MTQVPSPWLAVRDLSLARGPRRLLDRVSFELCGGAALLLHGPNGSGKSSLLRALLGLSVADGGEIHLQGERFAPGTGKLCRFALYQGHASGLKGELAALENLALAAALDGCPAGDADLRRALADAGIGREAAIAVRRLSQGQKQRLVLARFALANQMPMKRRPLWLLDEPSAALDRGGAAMLDNLLAAHLAGGGAAIVATHLPILGNAHAALPRHTIELSAVQRHGSPR